MRSLPALILFLFAGMLFAAAPKVIQELTGKVVSVTDGDTVRTASEKWI